MLVLCLIGLAVLLSFNSTTIWLGLGVIPIVALYPFVKRFSHWPQAVLGLAFNWGALLGWPAVLGRLDWPAVVLYAGAVAWTIGYDTIYAHQDREDDDLIGLKSTALKFGRATKPWLALLYAIAWLAITAAGIMAHAGTAFLLGMMAAAAQLAWQVATLDIDDAENCLAALPLQPRFRRASCSPPSCSTWPLRQYSELRRRRERAQKATGPQSLSP